MNLFLKEHRIIYTWVLHVFTQAPPLVPTDFLFAVENVLKQESINNSDPP